MITDESNEPSRLVRTSFFIACILALIAKIYCGATTFGTNDTGLFELYGRAVAEVGLEETYRTSTHFNHTPFLASILAVMHVVSSNTGFSFPLLLRLPGIFADLVVCLVLWRLVVRERPGIVPIWWCVVFALSPVCFMVSGYHGNFDSVMAMFLFLSAYQCVRGNSDLSAVFLALAIHVKVAPIIVSPVFFFFWLARGKGVRFFLVTSALVLAVWLIPLVQYPTIFLRNVLGYSSYWGTWGITYWLRLTGNPDMHLVSFYGLTAIQKHIMLGMKIAVLSAVLGIAWRRRKCEPEGIFTTLSLVWSAFFVFAPGVLLHYLVWPSCCVLLYSRKLYTLLLVTGSVFLFLCYTVINGGIPWDKGLFRVDVLELWLPFSNIPWFGFIILLIAMLRDGTLNVPPRETH